jgi:iron(III) transport system substrate-binding protein
MKMLMSASACLLGLLISMAPVADALAQANAAQKEAMLLYQGADRDQKLVQEARKEGSLTWYTSFSPGDSAPLAQAFEKKYGIKVEIWRAISEKIVQRVVTEGRANRNVFDVVETNGPELEVMSREKLLARFWSPHFADMPAFAIAPNGMWVADHMAIYVVAYNTKLVRREDLPKSYEGFIDPKWKGRIGVEAGDGEWMAAMIKSMGQERGMAFMRNLSDMKPDVRTGHILLAELVSSGEVPVALTAYHVNAIALKQKGGPIDYVALDPVVIRPQSLGIARNAPHPHAALLFTDFMLSEGQAMMEGFTRAPVSKKINSEFNRYRYVMITPDMAIDDAEKWRNLWDNMFVKK